MQVLFDQLRQLWMATLHHVVLKVVAERGGKTQKGLKKQPCFWLGFFPLSEKARSDPVLWLICMQSKYCSSPDSEIWLGHFPYMRLLRDQVSWALSNTCYCEPKHRALCSTPSPSHPHWAVIISVVQKKTLLSRVLEVQLPVLLWRLSLLTCFRIAPVYPWIWSFSKPCSFVTWLALPYDSTLL